MLPLHFFGIMPKRGAAETLDLVQAELARTDISDDRKLKRIYIQATKWIVRNLDGLGPDRPPEKSSPCSLKPPGFPPPIVGTAPLKNLAPTTLPRSAPGEVPKIQTDPHGILFSALRRPHRHLPHRHPPHRRPLSWPAAPATPSSGLRPEPRRSRR